MLRRIPRHGIRPARATVHDAVPRFGAVLVFAICVVAASLQRTRAGLPLVPFVLPPVPPLPAAGWPLPEVAEPFARALIAKVPAMGFESAADNELVPAVLRNLGTALLSRDVALRNAVNAYAIELARSRAERVPTDFSDDDLHRLIAFQVVDPLRYTEDEEFRRAVDTILPRTLSTSLPEPLRRADLNELNRVAPINFETSEALAVAAGLVARPSATRFDATTPARILTNGSEQIEASIYSINSRFVKLEEAKRFLAAVRTAAPKRRIVVIGDEIIRNALSSDLRIDFIDNFNRPLTPWPRDPFSVARTPDGGIVFINRPNLQRNREEDATMVRVMLDGLPKTLDERWKARWTTSATSFHNGQVLLTREAAWISMHSVEFRALELLGADHVPVEDFASAQGIARYTGAVQRAAKELSEIYGRPVRFIHELARTAEQIEALGGGAGFDLDSIVTLLPHTGGSTDALIGDLRLGRKLAATASASELQAMNKTYALRDDTIMTGNAAARLQAFLDRCAKDLAASGMRVRRLPLLMLLSPAPTDENERSDTPYFLLTWNNVVLEHNRAEGFASGLASGDRTARAAFKAAGYDLVLFPPLPRSVILNGGYRCASNEVRAVP